MSKKCYFYNNITSHLNNLFNPIIYSLVKKTPKQSHIEFLRNDNIMFIRLPRKHLIKKQ